jgi:type II secretory pathway component GspD/PulD (secretin)
MQARILSLVVCSLLAVLVIQSPGRTAEKTVNVDLQDVGLREAVRRLAEDTQARWKIEANVPNVPVTLRLKNVSPQSVLRVLIRVAALSAPALTLTQEGETFVVKVGATPTPAPALPAAPDPRLARKVSVNFMRTDLRAALAKLFEGTEAPYLVLWDVPNVPITLKLTDRTVQDALKEVLQVAYGPLPGLYMGEEGGVYLFGLYRQAPPERTSMRPGPDQRGSLNIRELPLRKTLELLFRNSGLEFEVAPGVPDPPVRVNLRDVTLEEAIQLVVTAVAEKAPGLTFTKKEKRYFFYLKEQL